MITALLHIDLNKSTMFLTCVKRLPHTKM